MSTKKRTQIPIRLEIVFECDGEHNLDTLKEPLTLLKNRVRKVAGVKSVGFCGIGSYGAFKKVDKSKSKPSWKIQVRGRLISELSKSYKDYKVTTYSNRNHKHTKWYIHINPKDNQSLKKWLMYCISSKDNVILWAEKGASNKSIIICNKDEVDKFIQDIKMRLAQ